MCCRERPPWRSGVLRAGFAGTRTVSRGWNATEGVPYRLRPLSREGTVPHRIAEQQVGRRLLRNAGPQERIVRRVLEQSPHEIGHAGNQIAVRHIDPQPLAPIDERPLFGVRHAVEHLQLQPALRNAERLGVGDSLGDRTQVVAPQRRPQVLAVAEHEASLPLEVGIRLPLLLPYRDRPAVRLGFDRLVVPVSSLHQSHPDRRSPLGGPVAQLDQIPLRVAQVALHHNAHVGHVPKLRLREDRLEDVQRQVLLLVRLHVDVNERPLPSCNSKQLAEPRPALPQGAGRVDRVELTVESRQLDRQVHPRQQTAIVPVDLRLLRPTANLRRNRLEQFKVGAKVLLGFRFARDRLAKDVEREAALEFPLASGCAKHRLEVFAGDEPASEVRGAEPRRIGHQRTRQRKAVGQMQSMTGRASHASRRAVEILEQMAGHGVARVQHRQHVDKAEQLHLQPLVAHRPVENAVVPIPPLPDVGLPSLESAE